MERQDVPPVSAVFLVVFDQKVGYTIAWKRNLPEIDLDGVEYKSLPSGLHAVKEDLIYFIHGAHAGVSVFVQDAADAKHRNANFAAVGALVPLSYGQLGRSWIHAAELRRLARDVVKNTSDTRALELFWKEHRADQAFRRSSLSPAATRDAPNAGLESRKRKRALSDATLADFNAEGTWPPDHPALHVPAILDMFGPLLFPLHRAVLSRKRVLLLGSPSVQDNANTVYIASVLSSIPRGLGESLPPESEPLFRSVPLFSVGIHDIPSLSSRDDSTGWVACTTDDILGEKKYLYDLLVQLPASQPAATKIWPKLKTSDGKILKASQRDLRRWTLLRRELRRLRRQMVGTYSDDSASAEIDESDERPLLRRNKSSSELYDNTGLQERDEAEATEPSTWTSLAYKGFMWWASAGEASAWENDETKADEELLFDMPDVGGLFPEAATSGKTDAEREMEYSRAAATMLVAYFRRVTEVVLRTMSAIVEEADDETEEGIQEDEIQINGEDVRAMGLDSWSEADKGFVADMVKVWFDRDAVVTDQGVRVCGMRIC
ncbi:hypothetical protein M409DRAFT_28135 [Zasmidium cellare ATCC 36951]|uniref:DUF4484 domain-containing protein n=1 Tax=Zasmidium cellare ATCC 36951 TaxID=1080233 RepID=A0A6A6C2X7_ZASCE|nr:uncharacterized protein M409DRAFT_28135 [Zasmidium cellare ATCC 36951]KAF2161401.1 hypothetical protein M409DRAFT_28135 [Zasmidium cellare ATCC 36951]